MTNHVLTGGNLYDCPGPLPLVQGDWGDNLAA
jgi:hypothetical protein